jgi:hypothetical protein
MKTPMKEVVEELIKLRNLNISVTDDYLQSLLQKERDLLYHAFYAGVGFDSILDDCDKIFEQYYNETFNKSITNI